MKILITGGGNWVRRMQGASYGRIIVSPEEMIILEKSAQEAEELSGQD